MELRAEEREGVELCGNKRKVVGSYAEKKEGRRKLCRKKGRSYTVITVKGHFHAWMVSRNFILA